MNPKKPFRAVSAYLHQHMRTRGVTFSKEVILIIDAEGDLWRMEGEGKWEKVA